MYIYVFFAHIHEYCYAPFLFCLFFYFSAYLADLSLSVRREASLFFTSALHPIVCMHDMYQSPNERKVVSSILLLQTMLL